LVRTLVVAGTLVGVATIALVSSARDGSHGASAQQPSALQAFSGIQSPGAAGVVAPAVVQAPADANAASAAVDPAVTSDSVAVDPAATGDSVADLATADDNGELTADCVVEPKSMAFNATGMDVMCLQQALVREGFYTGAVSGTYDYATSQAVESYQKAHDLYVDGVAGRETGKALGIWPDEQMFVVHTTPLPAGTRDEMGFAVSSVTALGDDIPPLPENSGSGRRVVYERISQRVWAVAEDGHVIRSWLVTGSQYNNEIPGTHEVYSRSEQSTAWNGRAILPYMIRWLKTERGAIGFHGIPIHVEDGTPYQTEAELGTRMSGGCQRQADPDAAFMWEFAQVGTTVVVI